MNIFVGILGLVALAQCGPIVQENESVLGSVIGNFVNCVNSDLSLCLKEKALQVTERVSGIRQLKLADGLVLINNDPKKEGRSLEPLSTDLEVRRQQVSERLSERTARLIDNADIEISFPFTSDDDDESDNAVESGRAKKKQQIKKKLRMLMPILHILKTKAILLGSAAVAIIAAAIIKLAFLAKIAFIVKAIFLIKSLLYKKSSGDVVSEWVPHQEEHIEHHGHGWEGGWARTKTEANNLAYSGYNNNNINN